VHQQLDEDDTLFATERHVLYTSREGLYDMLPQSLFHQSAPPKNANGNEVLDYFKQHKVEEKNARLFFLPFETSINHAKIANAVSELTLQKRTDDAQLKNMFARYWPILKMM